MKMDRDEILKALGHPTRLEILDWLKQPEKHFAGQDSLVLVSIDADALGTALKWEASRGGALFPHLYGDLPLSAVTKVEPIALLPDGRHRLPELCP